jgi:phage terminase small subunit
MPRQLTERQAAFCRHVIEGNNATKAARLAGYSPTYADRQAKQLLENPQVAARLAALRANLEAKTLVTAEEVINGLKHEATTADAPAARVAAWAHLGKHLGMFNDRTEHTGELRIRVIRD